MPLLGIAGFLAVGIALGLLGGGGSILAVPVLVHLLGVPLSVAVPMSLPVVGVTAAVGAVMRWRAGHLRLRATLLFALITMATSFVAARLGSTLPARPRLLFFVIVMLVAALFMWWRSSRSPAATATPAGTPPLGKIPLVLAGLAVGTITGIAGIGGGFLVVPALTGVLGLSLPQATATSLTVIALNTLSAGAGWYGRVSIDPRLTLLATATALVGMVIGTRLAPRVSPRALGRAFAIFLLLLGSFMLWQEFAKPSL